MKKLIAITALLAICCSSAFAGWSPWSWSFKWGQGQAHKGGMSSIALSLSQSEKDELEDHTLFNEA